MCVILNEKKSKSKRKGDVLVSTIQKKRESEKKEKEWADLLWVMMMKKLEKQK